MLKKFSRLLMVFTVAISLTGISETESNAQECGGCGQPACTPVYESGGFGIGPDKNGLYEAWYLIVGERNLLLYYRSEMFFASKFEVWDGCLVCRDSINGEHETALPDGEPKISAEIYSPTSDLQRTGKETYELTQEVCSSACGSCDGNVRELTLQYNGTSSADISVLQDDVTASIFKGPVKAGGKFSFTCNDIIRGMGNEINILINNKPNATINIGCSVPVVGPGLVSGAFTVISGISNNGGRLCPLDESGCIQSEFENIWGLGSKDCTNNLWEPDQIRATAIKVRGRILDDCSFFGDGVVDPSSCTEVEEKCLICLADKGCEASDWDEVVYACSSLVPCDD